MLAMLALAVAGCGGDDEEPAAADTSAATTAAAEPTTVKVATFAVAGTAGIHIADSKGYFTDEGLELQADTVDIAQMIPTVLSGSDDFGVASSGALLQAASQGLGLRIVAPAYYGTPAEQGIYVAKDSPIQSIEDLKGKTIATGSLKSAAHAGILMQLEEAGLKPSDVKVVIFPFPDIPAALRAGELEAGHMAEPGISAAGDSVREVIDNIYPFGDDPGVTYWFTSDEFAEANPDVVEGFAAAVNRAQDDAAGDDSVAREAIAGYTEIDAALLESMALPGFGSDMKRDQFEQQAEEFVKYGFLTEAPDIDALFE
jgi:NitT/TauT family transport system substrate-binding protein